MNIGLVGLESLELY